MSLGSQVWGLAGLGRRNLGIQGPPQPQVGSQPCQASACLFAHGVNGNLGGSARAPGWVRSSGDLAGVAPPRAHLSCPQALKRPSLSLQGEVSEALGPRDTRCP